MDTQLRYELRKLMHANKCNWSDVLVALTTEIEEMALTRLNDRYDAAANEMTTSMVSHLTDAQSIAGRLTYSGYLDNRALKPVAGVDYDPNAPMCHDDYEYFTKTGAYA